MGKRFRKRDTLLSVGRDRFQGISISLVYSIETIIIMSMITVLRYIVEYYGIYVGYHRGCSNFKRRDIFAFFLGTDRSRCI